MAKLKNYRAIQTSLFLAITGADFSRACYKVLLVVIHFTLGYDQRTDAQISHKTFMKLTGLSRPAVREALRQLNACNVVIEVKQGYSTNNPTIYALNTDFETWHTSKVPLPSTGKLDLPSEDIKTYPVSDQNLPSTGKVFKPATMHLKKERKLINKDVVGSCSDITFKEDGNYQKIKLVYAENIGAVTPIIAQVLKEISGDPVKFARFSEAVKIAVSNGAPKLSYVEAVLEKWDTYKKPKATDDPSKRDLLWGVTSTTPSKRDELWK